MVLEQAIIRLEQTGLTDVLLPFALIFTIIYAVSAVVPHLDGENNKKLRIVLSLVVSLMVVIPHVTRSYPNGLDVVQIINASLPQVVMLIVAVVLVLILLAATTGQKHTFEGHVSWIRWAALIIVGLIFMDNINFGYGHGFLGSYGPFSWFSDPDLQALLIVVIVFGLVVYFVTGGVGSSRGKITYNGKAYPSHSALNRELMDAGLDADTRKKILSEKVEGSS